jgi:hypothetical protein
VASLPEARKQRVPIVFGIAAANVAIRAADDLRLPAC